MMKLPPMRVAKAVAKEPSRLATRRVRRFSSRSLLGVLRASDVSDTGTTYQLTGPLHFGLKVTELFRPKDSIVGQWVIWIH